MASMSKRDYKASNRGQKRVKKAHQTVAYDRTERKIVKRQLHNTAA